MNEYINLANSRRSWSFFKNTEVPKEYEKIILEQANCITPALADNYLYRIDKINYEMKPKMWHYMHSTYVSGPPNVKFLNTPMEEALDPKFKWHEKNVCINHHFTAPLVLMFSIPVNGVEIGEETNNMQIGLTMWHIAMVAQSLGLNSTYLRAFDQKGLNRTISLSDEKGNPYRPMAFVCIGYGETKKDVDPNRKTHLNIVNTLNIKPRKSKSILSSSAPRKSKSILSSRAPRK